MWQISPTRWLNPLAIAHVNDRPKEDELTVFFHGGSYEHGADKERYKDADRLAVLAFLARHSQPMPYRDSSPNDVPFDDDPSRR